MSIFKLLEELYARLPAVIRARGNKLEVIRKWINMYFDAKRRIGSKQSVK
ncbi:MAG: hypothetical protein ABW044_05370 [Cellvibrio sp.]